MRWMVMLALTLAVAAGSPGRADPVRAHLDVDGLPAHLRDRGPGIPVSMFGTYVQPGQLLVYPFFEYYRDADYEYAPDEFGFADVADYRGRYRALEALLFLGYGVTDRVALEIEAAIIDATLERADADRSGVPEELSESGLGDVEGQLRVRWMTERGPRPELFTYLEIVGPTQDAGSLIGTTDWEFKLGLGLIRGFGFGTVTLRGAYEHDRAEDVTELGEVALEVLRRLSSRWRVMGMVEGTQDEVELVTEVQWHVTGSTVVKLNSGFGITSKATDWAPEVGVLWSF